MFEITAKREQYATYVVSDPDSGVSLEVVPERGGIVTRWQVQGKDILYLDAERFADPSLSVRGGIPVLFPICGNLSGNSYTYDGLPYTLKQHGFARDLAWDVVEQKVGATGSLTLELHSSEQTRLVYPFDFGLAFTYLVQGDTLTIHQRYTNQASVPMPFAAGFHPYFQVSDKNKLEFDIPASSFIDQQNKTSHPFSGKFDFEQDEIDAAFIGVSSQMATVVDHNRALKLTLDYSSTFSTLVFWTIQGKDYYCLEPWTAPRNALNTGEHLLYLDPQASMEMMFTLQASFL